MRFDIGNKKVFMESLNHYYKSTNSSEIMNICIDSRYVSKKDISRVHNILNDDFLTTGKEVKTFAWFEDKPLNYNLNNIPRTQNIKPVLFETSAFYIFKKNLNCVSRHSPR